MTEYNAQYRDLKNRLTTLRILAETDSTSSNTQRTAKLVAYDSLLKLLDDKYSDEKDLGLIETQVSRLEGN